MCIWGEESVGHAKLQVEIETKGKILMMVSPFLYLCFSFVEVGKIQIDVTEKNVYEE